MPGKDFLIAEEKLRIPIGIGFLEFQRCLDGQIKIKLYHAIGKEIIVGNAAILAGLVTGAACGLLNGAIIAKSKCIPLVITLGTSKMFYGIALTVSGGRIMNFGGAFNGLKTKYFEIFSPMLLVLLAMVMVAYLMMTYTKFGRRVVALGGNEKNAFLSGINVNRYKIIVYGISGLFCAVASIVFVARIDSITSNAGTNYETNALAAAIIGGVTFDGGKGTISGAFLGCLLMGVISRQ